MPYENFIFSLVHVHMFVSFFNCLRKIKMFRMMLLLSSLLQMSMADVSMRPGGKTTLCGVSYEIHNVIVHQLYREVFQAKNEETGQMVAIKSTSD